MVVSQLAQDEREKKFLQPKGSECDILSRERYWQA
jgi:hypothetical protein